MRKVCSFLRTLRTLRGGGSYVSLLCRAVSSLGPDLGWRQRRRTTPLQSTGHPPAGPQPQQLRTPQEAPPVLLLKLPVWNRQLECRHRRVILNHLKLLSIGLVSPTNYYQTGVSEELPLSKVTEQW